MKVIVVDPKGITVAGKRHDSGSVVNIPDGAALKAFLHFQQVIPPKEKEPAKPDPALEKQAENPPGKEPAKPKK
jgi:hypothetical protein